MLIVRRLIILLILFLFLLSNALAQEEDSLTFLFELSLHELMNIPVTSASKKEEPINEAPATIMVITSQQIQERNYESIEDILKDIPGFDIVNVQGTFPIIWAQRGSYGAENKRTLLMIDGIIENNILEGNVLGGPQYSLHYIDRIEIIWGPASALYGVNAYNGIINIITKKGNDIDGLEYQKGYGSFNTKFDKFITGTKNREIEFTLAGSLYNTDGPVFKERHPNYTGSYVENAYSIVSRLKYKNVLFGFHRFDRPMGIGQFSNSPSYYQLPGYGYQNTEGDSLGGAQTNINGEYPGLWHSVTQSLFIKYNLNFNNKTEFKVKLYYRTSEIADDSYEYDYIGNNKFSRDVYAHWSNSIGGEIQFDYQFNKKHDLITGIQYEQSNVEQGYRPTEVLSDDQDYTIMRLLSKDDRIFNIYNNSAAFVQYRLKTSLFKQTNFIAGVRYDYNNIYGGTTNPRGGVVIKPSEKLTLKGLAGTAYRAPNSFELFSETTIRVQNPELKPEKLINSELGIIYQFNKNLMVEGNCYYNELSNMIVSNVPVGDVTGDGIDNFQNQNVGSAQILGVELKTKAYFSNDFSCFLNFTWQDATYSENNVSNEIPNISNYKGNIGFRYQLIDLLIFSFTENIVGDRSTSITNPYTKIDGYYISNLSITSKNLFNNHIAVSVLIKNLFDQEYVDPGIRAATGEYYGTRHVQPGRNTYIKLTLSL
ncbi:TonB-dependent receptor plug domain-containing protein [Bacteroidota bacterium]